MLTETEIARFFSKLKLNPLTGCLEWQGGLFKNGYGSFAIGRKGCRAHRVAAYLAGMIPQIRATNGSRGSDLILHTCDNRKCCDPAHLFVGTHQDNMDDAVSKDRLATTIKSEDVQLMRELYATGGYSINKLAQRFSCDSKVTKDILFGVARKLVGGEIATQIKSVNIPTPTGTRSLTLDQASDIRLFYEAGIYSQPHLARTYNVSQRLISDICRNKRYKS